MNNDLIAGSRQIAKGTLHRLAARPGRRIECLSGCLWITQDGDRRDVILEAGDGFDFDRRTGALASALDDSRYLFLSA